MMNCKYYSCYIIILYFHMPVTFDVVVVGSGGGPDETNLSALVYS